MAWLTEWKRLLLLGLRSGVAGATWTASCAFHDFAIDGDEVFRKEFRFIWVHLARFVSRLHRRCPRTHAHERIQGSHTRHAATYTRGLTAAFVDMFLQVVHFRRTEGFAQARVFRGSERVVVTELLLSGQWNERRRWTWRGPGHINVLESQVICSWLREAAIHGGDSRLTAIVDSRVSLCAHAKGRTPSRALAPVVRRSAA